MMRGHIQPKPEDWIKIRCDKSADERLFKVGKVYKGYWRRVKYEDGHEAFLKGYEKLDENGESFNTYREPWFGFTIVEGLTEPPKE